MLDNTSGSGSFLVSALQEGRNFIGIEKNEDGALFKKKPVDYIKITRSRIKEAIKDIDAATLMHLKKINLLSDEDEVLTNEAK